MNLLLTEKIFLNKDNWRFYIVFNNSVYQFNGEIIEIYDDDLDILQWNNFTTFNNIDIDKLYNYLKDDIDIYNILESCDFYIRWRLVKVIYNGQLYTAIIANIMEKMINDIDLDIYTIDVLLETGHTLTILKEYIHSNIQPLTSDIDIKIDGILEVLWYYNVENLDINFKQFLK